MPNKRPAELNFSDATVTSHVNDDGEMVFEATIPLSPDMAALSDAEIEARVRAAFEVELDDLVIDRPQHP